ncbi:MAG TPA: putative zinc-binding protein [Candidatus Desulfaltia sp.]|nr:putative zinc-binding protein [Candidatus Desulfaltia sp.]
MNIKPKVGVISCSGECCSLGTLSRVATRMILEGVRPGTVTLCLPLFLAGDSGEREFAQRFPTIPVDGCHKQCAKKAIEKYSGPTAVDVDVEVLLGEWGAEPPASRRVLGEDDIKLAERVAMEIAKRIDWVQSEQDA